MVDGLGTKLHSGLLAVWNKADPLVTVTQVNFVAFGHRCLSAVNKRDVVVIAVGTGTCRWPGAAGDCVCSGTHMLLQ